MIKQMNYFDVEEVRKLLEEEINQNIEASFGDDVRSTVAWGRYREARFFARKLGFKVVEVDAEQYEVQYK